MYDGTSLPRCTMLTYANRYPFVHDDWNGSKVFAKWALYPFVWVVGANTVSKISFRSIIWRILIKKLVLFNKKFSDKQNSRQLGELLLESWGQSEKASIAFQCNKKLKFLDFTASVMFSEHLRGNWKYQRSANLNWSFPMSIYYF